MAVPSVLATQSPTLIGVLALPGGGGIYPTAISADGAFVVGESSSSFGTRAFRWTAAGGLEDLGIIDTGVSSAYGVSNDGATVVGRSGFIAEDRAFRWSSGSGMTQLLTQRAVANGISGDGSVIVGEFSIAVGGAVRAFRSLPGGGFQSLGTLDPANLASSIAYGVSRDGSMIFGASGTGEPGFGPNVSSNFRWRQSTGMVAIPNLPGATGTISTDSSQSGDVISGYAYINSGINAVRWTAAGQIEDLGRLPGSWSTLAECISDNGRVIGGYAGTDNGNAAFLWTPDLGYIDLTAELAARGVNMSQWRLDNVTALSADGSTITGTGFFRGFQRMFVVRNFVLACTRSDVAGGNQAAGADGQLTADDIIAFLGFYFANDTRADVAGPNQSTTPDGSLTADDILVFLNRYFAGC